MTGTKRQLKLKKLLKMKNVYHNNLPKKRKVKSSIKGVSIREYDNRKVDRANGVPKKSQQK